MMQSRRETLVVALLLVLVFNASPAAAQDWRAIVGSRFLPYGEYCADTQTIVQVFYDWAQESGNEAAQQKAFRLLEKVISIGRRTQELIDTTIDFSAGADDISVGELGGQWRAIREECRALRKEIDPKLVSWSSKQQTTHEESPNDSKATVVNEKLSEPKLPMILPPKKVVEGIRKRAQKDWPQNYSMQLSIIETQTAAYEQLQKYERPRTFPPRAFSFIKEKLARDYPWNYSIQLSIIERQVAAYDELQQYQCPQGVAASHFFQMKQKAARDWPYNYSMQLSAINRVVDAYLRLRDRGASGDAIMWHLRK